MGLGAVERVLDERVVQGAKEERPEEVHRPHGPPLEHVAQHRAFAARLDLATVLAPDPEVGGEAKGHAVGRTHLSDLIAHGPVPATGAPGQRAVEAHGRPALPGPQLIMAREERLATSDHTVFGSAFRCRS